MVEGESRPPTEDCRNQPDWKRRLGEATGLRRAEVGTIAFFTDLKNFHEEEVGLFSFCVLVTETPYLTGTMWRTHRADGLWWGQLVLQGSEESTPGWCLSSLGPNT